MPAYRLTHRTTVFRPNQTAAAQHNLKGILAMFANIMNTLDRTALSLMVVLAATPILSIAARAAFL